MLASRFSVVASFRLSLLLSPRSSLDLREKASNSSIRDRTDLDIVLSLYYNSRSVHGPLLKMFYCAHTVFALLGYGILDLLIQPLPLELRHYSQVPYKHKVHWFMQSLNFLIGFIVSSSHLVYVPYLFG